MVRKTNLAMAVVFVMTLCTTVVAKTIYVDDNAAAGANNGSCWAEAYKFLQDALSDANAEEKPVEICVAQGVYTPDRTAAGPEGTADRDATFQLINGVTLQGGYAGLGQPDPNLCDHEFYKTILSGDLYGNDDPNMAKNL